MPDFLASSGPVDVVASGTVISFEGNPIEILFDALVTPLEMSSLSEPQPLQSELPVGGFAGRFKVIFKFVDEAPPNPSQPLASRVEMKRSTTEALAMIVTLFNYISLIGTGTSKPIQFAFAGGRNLFLHYRVWAVGGTDKTIQFSIYQSKIQDHKPPESQTVEKESAIPSPSPSKETNG